MRARKNRIGEGQGSELCAIRAMAAHILGEESDLSDISSYKISLWGRIS